MLRDLLVFRVKLDVGLLLNLVPAINKISQSRDKQQFNDKKPQQHLLLFNGTQVLGQYRSLFSNFGFLLADGRLLQFNLPGLLLQFCQLAFYFLLLLGNDIFLVIDLLHLPVQHPCFFHKGFLFRFNFLIQAAEAFQLFGDQSFLPGYFHFLGINQQLLFPGNLLFLNQSFFGYQEQCLPIFPGFHRLLQEQLIDMQSLGIHFLLIHFEAGIVVNNDKIQHGFIKRVSFTDDQGIIPHGAVKYLFHPESLFNIHKQDMAFFYVIKFRILVYLDGFLLDELAGPCHFIQFPEKISIGAKHTDFEIRMRLYVVVVFNIFGNVQDIKRPCGIVPCLLTHNITYTQ